MITEDVLVKFAKKVVKPDNYGSSDNRRYRTFAPVSVVAINQDELIDESNFYAFVQRLTAVHEEDNERWFIAREQHWGWGPLDVLYVRMYEEDGEFSPEWKVAVAALEALEDYPLLDEEDYSDREYHAFLSSLDQSRYYLMQEAGCTHEDTCPHWEEAVDLQQEYQVDGLYYRMLQTLKDLHSE